MEKYLVPRRMRNVAKRANRINPREDRNIETQFPEFITRESRRRERQPEELSMRYKRVEMLPRNIAQETYIEALEDDSKTIVLGVGCAGTGKTYLATLYAIKGLQEGRYKKIIITRPAVSVDEQHGFLPGDLLAKLAPWCVPVLDILKEHYSVPVVKKLLENESIELAALSFMRGRNLKNAVILCDEMQNALPSQIKMLTTRIAEGSKMIICGDLEQFDRGFEANGFKDFITRLEKRGSDQMEICRFERCDIERHPVVDDILRLYQD